MTRNATSSKHAETLPEDSLTPEQMQRVLQAGEQASQLLNAPIYNIAYQQILNQKFQEWLGSDPKEERRRESLYLQAKGLTEVTELLGSAVADAQRVAHAQKEANDPNLQMQSYDDQQGFGLNFN